MPTLYTALRARHRHARPKVDQPDLPAPKPRTKGKDIAAPLLKWTAAVTSPAKPGLHAQKVVARKKVIVVGAGLAGLCAAFELKAMGYEVDVYEARNRVGGRVHTLRKFARGKKAEAGAELIGSNHPLWIAYKEHFGLHFTDVKDYGNSPIRLKGRTLTFEESEKLIDEMEAHQKALEERAATIVDPFEPWTNRDASRLDGVSLMHWLNRLKKCSRRSRQALAEMLAADNGVPAKEQSLLGVLAMIKGGGLHQYWTDAEVYRCKEGNDELASQFQRELNRGGPNVHLNRPVESITEQKESGKVAVKIKGKREPDEADDVILAVPPSVWNGIIFEDKSLARILRLAPGMGSNVKYLMRFNERFWENFGNSPSMTEDGPVDITWETTEAKKSPDHVMVAFSGSDDAKECLNWSPSERRANYVRALQPVYPGIGGKMRHSEFQDWPNKEWTKASYYFPRINEVTRWGPFWKAGYGGWLHFAGEHTCYAFMGYMEGALSSGFRLARRLAVRDGIFSA